MQQYTNEYGRSMVEILGVLAVIGVLSIGGIQGYKYAMDKHRANDVVNEVNMRATDIWHLYQDGKKALPEVADDEDAFPEYGEMTQTGFPILVTSHPPVAFRVWVNDVPSAVCQKVLQENLNEAIQGMQFVQVDNGGGLIRYMGDTAVCGENGTENQMVFTSFLDVDNSGNIDPDNPDNTLPSRCVENGDCQQECGETICDEDTQQCINICDGTDKPYCVDDVCVECMTAEDCANPEKPVCNANHFCEACPDDKPIYNFSTKVCELCPDETPIWHNKTCVECGANINCRDASKPVCNTDNVCEACPITTPIYLGDKCVECRGNSDCQDSSKPICNGDNSCEACPNDNPKYNATTGECESCPTDKPMYHNGQCVECIANTDCQDASKPACDINNVCGPCPNDKPYWYNGQCNVCPEGASWSDEHNGCIAEITLTSDMITSYSPKGLTEPIKTAILDLTFPATITSGSWKIIGTDIKASLDGAVQLGYCVEWSSHFDLTDNIVDLDGGTLSDYNAQYLAYGACWDRLGQNLKTSISKTNNVIHLEYMSASYYTGKIISTVQVNVTTIKAVMQ